jgi:hypothetical protein
MAADYYLQLDSIKGESADSRHGSWIECLLDRVMRALLLLLLLLVGPVCMADAPAPRMTGERLLKKFEPVEAAAISPDPTGKFTREELASLHTTRNVEFVHGYLAALYDETEGKAWCYDPKSKTPKPDTFYDESRWGCIALHRPS